MIFGVHTTLKKCGHIPKSVQKITQWSSVVLNLAHVAVILCQFQQWNRTLQWIEFKVELILSFTFFIDCIKLLFEHGHKKQGHKKQATLSIWNATAVVPCTNITQELSSPGRNVIDKMLRLSDTCTSENMLTLLQFT